MEAEEASQLANGDAENSSPVLPSGEKEANDLEIPQLDTKRDDEGDKELQPPASSEADYKEESSDLRQSGQSFQQSGSRQTARAIGRAARDQSQIERICQMFTDQRSQNLMQRQIDSLNTFIQENEKG